MTRLPTTSPLPDGCISDLQFDKWQAGELGQQVEQRLDLHVASCVRCTERKQQLAADAARFLAEFPTPPRAAKPSRLEPRRWRWLAAASSGLAAAAALMLWFRAPADDFGTRSKGTSRLSFFVKHAGEVTPGNAGQRVFAGDQLRFTVTTSKPQHLAILGRDGTGATFVYHPASSHSIEVAAGRDQALPSSIELDDTPGTETFWAIFCNDAFAVGPIRTTLSTNGKLDAPPGCSVETLHVEKGPRP